MNYGKASKVYVKLHKNSSRILADHTKKLHVAQDFDILRNDGKKCIDEIAKINYNIVM